MKVSSPYYIVKHVFRCFLLIIACFWANRADAVVSGIEANFIRNNTVLQGKDIASNVFSVKNHSTKSVRFRLKLSVPAGWNVLSSSEKEYELEAGDSIFLPVRVVPGNEIKGGTSYVITATMASDRGMQFSAQNWYVTLPVMTKWTANLPIKQQFFYNNNDSSGVELYLRNEGNADEELRITILPDRRLELLRGNGGAGLLSFTISLPAGTDTLLVFPVLRKPSASKSRNRDSDLYRTDMKENYSFQVVAKSTVSGGSWSGIAQFTKAGNIARQNDFGRSAMPLTLEANVYDVMSTGTTMSIDAYGNMNFPKNRLLNYRFQTVFISNYFNENSLLGVNNYIGYFADHFTVELGEVNGWGRSLLTGRGVKASYKFGDHTIGAMTTRSPGFFKNYTSEGYGAYYNFHRQNLNITSQYSTNTNQNMNLKNSVANSMGTYKINPSNQLAIGGGYSTEQNQFASTTGYGYELNYALTVKKVNVSLGNSHGTPNYILARGVDMFNSRTTYTRNQRISYSLTTQNFTQRPTYFYNGILRSGSYVRSDRYEGRIGMNSINSYISLKPTYLWEENQMLRVSSKLLGVEYNAKNIPGVRFSTMGALGYSRAVDYKLSDFFVARVGTYARWEKLYLSFRYTYGPVDAAEQSRFVIDQINPQTVHLSGSYDYWMANNKLLLTTTSNFMYETYFKKMDFRLRPELFYYTKSGLRLSMYASFFSNSQKANPLYDEQLGREPYEANKSAEMNFGFGVRKQFGIPVPGKRFITLNAVIFKDLNGNHIQDANEEGVENMLVTVKAKSVFNENDSSEVKKEGAEQFITDMKGQLSYENIPAGVYEIKCMSLTSNSEWFNGTDNEYKIDSKKTLYIALNRGVRINGSMLVERDKYTEQAGELDLSRIRVTAMDSTGKTYSVLTERNGNFLMNLPSGQYVISINESALGNDFEFTQSKINLDLSTNFENLSITFNAVEKKRKMEIKKFNGKE